MIKKLIRLYDILNCKACLDPVEKFTASMAILSFFVHIILITIAILTNNSWLENLVGRNYLQAITTPLNIVLLYEVFLLIIALPRSLIVSIQKQFEVVSLIIVREAFKVFGTVDINNFKTLDPDLAFNIGIFLFGGIICFALVAVMKILAYKIVENEEKMSNHKFIALKKIFSLFLILILVILSLSELVVIILNTFGYISYFFDYLRTFFYTLIFIDVLIFLSSLYFTDDYGYIFLDSALVVSTIIVRFALALTSLEKVLTMLFAIIAALSVIAVFNYLWKPQKVDLL